MKKLVRVYYNLNKHCWSVQHKVPGKGWRVCQHVPSLRLSEVTFRVSEAGRQRVLRQRRKNVHAYAIGFLESTVAVYRGEGRRIGYNPYRGPHFAYISDSMEVSTADQIVFTNDRKIFDISSQ